MSEAKPAFLPECRIWTAHQVAARLGWSDNKFRTWRLRLEAQGFPRRDELLAGWDGDAIQAWLNRRSGLTLVDDETNEWEVTSDG